MSKVYRYMSFNEFEALMNGIQLSNPKIRNWKTTNSCGFCFLAETTAFSVRNQDGIVQHYKLRAENCCFLDGIVSNDVLVEFEVKDNSLLRKGFGVYWNPYYSGYEQTITIDEYSCHSYNKTMLQPIRAKINSCKDFCYSWSESSWTNL